MKKLICTLLVLLCIGIANPSESANTATKIGSIPIVMGEHRYDADMILVAYDTTGTDLTIADATDTNVFVCAAGVFMSENAAQDISFKLNATNYITFKLAANQGLYDELSDKVS